MKYLCHFVLVGVILTGCGSNHVESVGRDVDSNNSHQAPEFFNYQNTTLSENFVDSTMHLFSDTVQKDRFYAFIPQGNINRTKITVVVISYAGDTIFADSMPTTYLINGNEIDETRVTNDKMMEAFVLRSARQVLSDSSFHSATQIRDILKDLPNEDFEDRDAYLATCAENRYFFLLSYLEEDTRYMCYSAINKRAVTVFSCC